MLTNKWIVVDKKVEQAERPYTYTLIFVGEPNCLKTSIIRTKLDLQVGALIKKDSTHIEPIENLYNDKRTKMARVELATCRDFYKNPSIKVSLFGIDYGIFEGVIHNPQSNLKLTRGDIITTALWKNPDNSVELHIVKNLTQKTQYIYDEKAKYTQEMVVLDADGAGAFDGATSYKHLLVNSHSGHYSIIVPSTSSFFSVHEQDEVLVLDNEQDNWFEILDNKTINDVISKYVRQK